MSTKTHWQSQSQIDEENDLGVSVARYNELAPVLVEFLGAYNVKLIFAYGVKEHSWAAIMSHRNNEKETHSRIFPYSVSNEDLLAGLKEMAAFLACKAIKTILYGEANEEEKETDDWEDW